VNDVIEERENAIEAKRHVVQVLRGRKNEGRFLAVVNAIREKNPELDEESVKAAIVSLLNQGVLDLTPDGRLRVLAAG
jgi:hypothetical protein